MHQIDSMRLQVDESDSIDEEGNLLPGHELKDDYNPTEVIHGSLGETSGTLYISPPGNKSGKVPAPSYPRFGSEVDSEVYFDDPRILNGAYDRSVRFSAPPFEVDSINNPDFTMVGFDGAFHSGPIMPPFIQKLSIMPDKSLGFTHEIQDKIGYPLYGFNNSHIHGQLRMDLGGLQANGQLEHQTTALQSEKYTFYLDKVVADIQSGEVRPGSVSGLGSSSYPKVSFEHVKLLWRPHKDNMLLRTKGVPMDMYDGNAHFEGTLNIKNKGAYASGMLGTDLVRAESDFFHFEESSYTGRQTNFEVLSSDPLIPAVRGKRIQLRYDLEKNIGYMQPEKAGIPSIDFPYMQMKTSMYEADWYYNERNVQMKRPESIPLEQSFFISTKPEMDSLTIQAEAAIYSMDSSQLRIEGVPYIRILDVDIVPENNRVLVRENCNIKRFLDATLYIDAQSRNHTLTNGNIKVHSANLFTGSADYQYANSDADTFYIKFNEFLLEKAVADDGKKKRMVVSGGVIPDSQLLKASAGFYFKGRVKMFAKRKSLFFDGFVKLVLEGEDRNIQWIKYEEDAEREEIIIDFDRARTEDGTSLTAGLHYRRDGQLYLTFMQDKDDRDDIDLFEPEGLLSYDTERNFYVVRPDKKKKDKIEDEKKAQEKKRKTKKDKRKEREADKVDDEESDKIDDEESDEVEDEENNEIDEEESDEIDDEESAEIEDEDLLRAQSSYKPKTFMYSPRTESLSFEGPLRLLGEDKHIDLTAAARGKANLKERVYELEAVVTLDVGLPNEVVELLAQQLEDARSYVELQYAQLPVDFYNLLAFLIGSKAAARHETAVRQKDPPPLHSASGQLHADFMFSRLRLKWDPYRRRWYSQGTLQLSHIQQTDVNADLQGYLQIEPQREGANIDILLYVSPTIWYHLSYRDQNLSLYSGLNSLNQLVDEETKSRSPVPGKYSFTRGHAGQTDTFVEGFFSRYGKDTKALDMKYLDPVVKDLNPTTEPSQPIEIDDPPTEEGDNNNEESDERR